MALYVEFLPRKSFSDYVVALTSYSLLRQLCGGVISAPSWRGQIYSFPDCEVKVQKMKSLKTVLFG